MVSNFIFLEKKWPILTKLVLKMAFHLGVWFMQTYGEWSFDSKDSVLPVIEDSRVVSEQILSELTDSYETKITKLQEELTNLREQQITQEALQARRKQAKDAAYHIRLSEAET